MLQQLYRIHALSTLRSCSNFAKVRLTTSRTLRENDAHMPQAVQFIVIVKRQLTNVKQIKCTSNEIS